MGSFMGVAGLHHLLTKEKKWSELRRKKNVPLDYL